MSVLERFKNIRIHFAPKQGEFAELLGTNQQSISDIERGKKSISFDVMEKLGKLNVNLNWLITGVGSMFVDENRPIIANESEVGYKSKFDKMKQDNEKLEMRVQHQADLIEYLKKDIKSLNDKINENGKVSALKNV